ncbi:MAG: hypothetical protein V6Z81_07280 [Parvularculales bacterium]
MKVENAVYPARDQIKALLDNKSEEPIVMVNLLRFNERAAYKDDTHGDMSGVEAYRMYGERMRKIVESRGARFIFTGTIDQMVIGSVEEAWHMVALVEYPSRQAFAEITSLPEVSKIAVFREAGLEGQLLIQAREASLS